MLIHIFKSQNLMVGSEILICRLFALLTAKIKIMTYEIMT